jgi:hypothetical protein
VRWGIAGPGTLEHPGSCRGLATARQQPAEVRSMSIESQSTWAIEVRFATDSSVVRTLGPALELENAFRDCPV